MNYYLGVFIIICTLGVLAYSLKNVRLSVSGFKGNIINSTDFSNRFFFVFPAAAVLIIFTGFRNNLYTDYIMYEYIYKNVIKSSGYKDIIFMKEPLFALMQKVIGEVSDYSIIVLMTVIAVLTVIPLMYFFRHESENVFLAFFLLITLGSYYTCFNATRNYLAAALSVLLIKKIYERDPVGYFFGALLITLIHNSAIVLFPMYWLLRVNWYSRQNIIKFLAGTIIFVLVCIRLESFLRLVLAILPTSYTLGNMDSAVAEGRSFVTIIRHIVIAAVVFLNRDRFDLKETRDRILLNGVLYFVVFQIFSMSFGEMYRFGYYMIPLALVAVTNSIERITERDKKLFWMILIVSFGILWNVAGQFHLGYAFFWQDNIGL